MAVVKNGGAPRRRTGLVRRTPLAARPVPRTGSGARTEPRPPLRSPRPEEPGERAWKTPRRWGRCALCDAHGRLILHHLVSEAEIRRYATPGQIAAGIAWDPRNALSVGAPLAWGGRCQCHGGAHSFGVRDTRIPWEKVPSAAREFAVEVLGAGPAEEYWRRHCGAGNERREQV